MLVDFKCAFVAQVHVLQKPFWKLYNLVCMRVNREVISLETKSKKLDYLYLHFFPENVWFPIFGISANNRLYTVPPVL